MSKETLRAALTAVYEAEEEAEKHRAKLKTMKSLPLGGKKTKMGEGYLFNKDGSPEDSKAAEGAYDAVANIAESSAEDADERAKRALKRYREVPLLIDAPSSKKRK